MKSIHYRCSYLKSLRTYPNAIFNLILFFQYKGSCKVGWSQTCCVGEDYLELLILFCPPLECWNYRHVLLCLCGSGDVTQGFLYAGEALTNWGLPQLLKLLLQRTFKRLLLLHLWWASFIKGQGLALSPLPTTGYPSCLVGPVSQEPSLFVEWMQL